MFQKYVFKVVEDSLSILSGRRGDVRNFISGLLVVTVFCNAALAHEDEFDLSLFLPRVGVSANAVRQKDFKDTGGQYSEAGAGIRSTLPLVASDLGNKQKDNSFYQLLVMAKADMERPNISFLSRTHILYKANAAISGIALTPGRNFYLLSLGLGFSEDDRTISQLNLRGNAFFLGSARASESLLFLYGLGFTYSTGKGLPIPLLGIQWDFEEDWTLQILLPCYVRVQYQANEDLAFKAFVKASGDRTRFANEGAFAAKPDTVLFKSLDIRLGVEGDYRVLNHISLKGEIGALGYRQISFADDSGDFLSSQIKPAGYLKLALEWRFGESLISRMGKLFSQ